MYKVISFDLWNTLVKSNPEFAKARIEVLKKHTDKSEEQIKDILKDIKYSFDALVEKFGIQFDSSMLYNLLFDQLNIFCNDGIKRTCLKIELQDLFLEHLPTFYDENTLDIIKKLKDKNYKLVIISNTLFIDGNYVNAAISRMGLTNYFDKIVYSWSLGLSKPNPKIFEHSYLPFNVNKDDIIHVGDNIRTDLYGATNYGVKGYVINNSKTSTTFKNKTITDFFNHLETNN